MIKRFILITYQNVFCFLVFSFQMENIRFQKLIFRIFQSALSHFIQFFMCFGCPCLKAGFPACKSQILPEHGYAVLFLQKVKIDRASVSPGRQHMIHQFLIRSPYNDLTILVTFSQFFLMDHIFHFTGTSNKIFFRHNMFPCFQEVPIHFNICTQMAPAASVNIKRLLYGFTDLIEIRLFSVQIQCHLIFGTGCDQKFLQMLVCYRLLRHSFIKRTELLTLFFQDQRKMAFRKKPVCFMEILLCNPDKFFHGSHFSA